MEWGINTNPIYRQTCIDVETHISGVGLTLGTRPRGKFFCPNCRFYEGALDREGDFRRMSANPPSRVAPQHQRPRGGGAR